MDGFWRKSLSSPVQISQQKFWFSTVKGQIKILKSVMIDEFMNALIDLLMCVHNRKR